MGLIGRCPVVAVVRNNGPAKQIMLERPMKFLAGLVAGERNAAILRPVSLAARVAVAKRLYVSFAV